MWIAPESLPMRDRSAGRRLAEKIAEGMRHDRTRRCGSAGSARSARASSITESNLDDDVEVREGARISRSQIRDGAIIGAGARLHAKPSWAR